MRRLKIKTIKPTMIETKNRTKTYKLPLFWRLSDEEKPDYLHEGHPPQF